MTWKHVAIIVFAFSAPLVCGLSSVCSTANMNGILTLSTLTIGGVLGHLHQDRSKHEKRTPEDKA